MPYTSRHNYNLSGIGSKTSLNVTEVSTSWECQMLKPAPVNKHTTVYSSTPAKWVDFDTIVLPYKEVEPVSTARDCKTQFYIIPTLLIII